MLSTNSIDSGRPEVHLFWMDITAPAEKKPMGQRLIEFMAASRFFMISLVLNLAFFAFIGLRELVRRMSDPPDFAASGGELVGSDVQAQAPPEQTPDMSQQVFTPQAPTLSAPTLSAISTTSLNTPTFTVAAAVPVVKPVSSDVMEKVMEKAANGMAKGIATGSLPGTMSGRAGGTARSAAMQKNNGKPQSEEAVLRGLRWLVKHQNEDGSWSKANAPAMTGFAMLSFLGHGETPVSAEFGPTVQKGLDWLLANGTKNKGHMSMTGDGWGSGNAGVYAHAIATYALGEYYTMTKDERVADLFKQAIGYIVAGQGPDGGWMYSYDKSESDTSVSGWQIQALKAAHLSDLKIEGVDAAMEKAMVNFKRVQGKKGGFGYRKAEDKFSLTGVGVLCTYFLKQEKDKSVKEGIEFMMEQVDKDNPVDYKGEKADLYGWYYDTQACLMVGGAAWTKWNRLFQDQIIKNQSPDGSWPVTAGKSPGGELQREPEGAGPFYRTNLCILMLEVYYRYMPTTK